MIFLGGVTMGLKVGDTFFARDGRPGVVVGREQKTDRLVVEREGPRFEKARHYGFINGLSPDERKEFEALVDDARDSKSSEERILKLQGHIEEIQLDPKKQVLTRYLEGELSHLMYSNSISPRVYTVDQDKT